MNHTYTWTVKKDKDRDLYRIRRSDGFEAKPSPRSLLGLGLAVGVQCNNVEMCHDVLRQVDETGEAEFTTTTVGGSLHHL